MKTSTILLFISIACSNLLFSQVTKDTMDINTIYAPSNFNGIFSEKESWENHKAAYLNKLKAQGLTDSEIKRSMVKYEKDKKEFIAKIKEQHKLAEIQRKKAAEQRELAEIERKKANVQRLKADELRKLVDTEREKAEELRGQAAIQRRQADELRKQADLERVKTDEQRKLSEIQRKKAEDQRKKDLQTEKED